MGTPVETASDRSISFHAGIKGGRYTFMCRSWGAIQNQIVSHWSNCASFEFPTFFRIQNDCCPGHLGFWFGVFSQCSGARALCSRGGAWQLLGAHAADGAGR
eukprot:2903717-Amphidinium_carterae.1